MSVVPMLRATIVGRSPDAKAVVAAVQDAGLLHVEAIDPPEDLVAVPRTDGGPAAYAARLRRVREGICAVAKATQNEKDQSLDALVDEVEALMRRREEAKARLVAVEAHIEALSPWGEFDPEDIDLLVRAGVPVTFARLIWNDWNELDASEIPHDIASQDELEVCVVFFGQQAALLPITKVVVPRTTLGAARAERDALLAEVADLERHIGSHRHRLEDLDDHVQLLLSLASGLDDGALFAVRGYVPADRKARLLRALANFALAIQFEVPIAGASVPVEIRASPIVQGFRAVVRAFSGISYWEKDFTPHVALLFLVFGSLCLLDGGYGVLLLITGVVLRHRGSRAFGEVFILTGAATALMGSLSGQYFGFVVGQNGFFAGYKPLLPLATDPMTSFVFSIVVGLAGMTFAYATAIWQRGPRTSATGSLLFVLGVILSAISAYSPIAVPSWPGTGFVGMGIVAWIVWPDRVFGDDTHIANALWTLYSGITGLGQDVMSYIRLFGIALSGSIMAMVVNQIAGLFPLVVTILVAIVGHCGVFVLSLLSLYIHTNRLIFLEFGSKCIDGGHNWYAPLHRQAAELQPR